MNKIKNVSVNSKQPQTGFFVPAKENNNRELKMKCILYGDGTNWTVQQIFYVSNNFREFEDSDEFYYMELKKKRISKQSD
jgi:hypothetical protein